MTLVDYENGYKLETLKIKNLDTPILGIILYFEIL